MPQTGGCSDSAHRQGALHRRLLRPCGTQGAAPHRRRPAPCNWMTSLHLCLACQSSLLEPLAGVLRTSLTLGAVQLIHGVFSAQINTAKFNLSEVFPFTVPCQTRHAGAFPHFSSLISYSPSLMKLSPCSPPFSSLEMAQCRPL